MRHLIITLALLAALPMQLSAQNESDAVLVLPVSVHLMRSQAHERLQSTLTEEEVRAIFEEVNMIWAPAGIRFEVDAIAPLQANDPPSKRWFVRDRNWVKSAIPSGSFRSKAVDVCFVKDMGPNGFFYGEPVVVCEKPDFTKVKGGAKNPVARVAAHELGHVLGLQHRQDHTNLMASARNGFSLNNQEIKDARKRAAEIIAAWASQRSLP